MFFYPIKYDEPLFRPPGEAHSAIVQATLGCSWNKCSFCEMYSSKKFKIRDQEELKSDIEALSNIYKGVKKVFIADGNAFVLSESKLSPILDDINWYFGRLQRISSYALPKDILSKSDEDLKKLRAKGLKLLYIGIETGDDEILELINKGETFQSTKEGILKAHDAGIDTSIMIINGLGGKKYSKKHAINSARIISELNPKFLSTLTLSLPYGEEHFKNRFEGEYIQQSIKELFEELKLFIENLETENTIYRSDHVSNNLILKGNFPKDKQHLIETLDYAIKNTDPTLYPESRSVL